MKKKFFFYYMVLIIIGLSVAGFFISELTQKFYIHEVEDKLKNTASLIQYQISEEAKKGTKLDFNQAAKKYAELLNMSSGKDTLPKDTGTRITFIDLNGKVVGESETDYQNMENHLGRKEVKEAIEGKVGEDIRFSKTLNIDFVYVAVPIKSSQVVVRISVPLRQVKDIDKIIWYYTIIGILAGLVLSALLALRFSSSIIRPVNELINVSKEISMGNYSKQVGIKSKDEIGQLSETFNDMAAKLEKTVADLIDKNVKVDSIMDSMTNGIIAVDTHYRVILINSIASEIFGLKYGPGLLGINILELIRNNQVNVFLKETIEKNSSTINDIIIGSPDEKVLRIHTNPIKSKDPGRANSGGLAFIQDITKIKKLEQIRTEFVSNVTHELKTPLTSIRGFIETLRSGAINDKEVAEKFLEIIDIEAERLYMLINDILQLSEIETKQKDSNIASYNLKSIIEETLSIMLGTAEKKNITLDFEADENLNIVANRDRIKQMIINLVDNAIKYNVENGKVGIRANKCEGKITISVKDTGIGISKEHLPRLFERFYRVDKGRSRDMGGTGLGLSIVKHIVNLYSGDIKVNSEPGKGTEFIIRLPA